MANEKIYEADLKLGDISKKYDQILESVKELTEQNEKLSRLASRYDSDLSRANKRLVDRGGTERDNLSDALDGIKEIDKAEKKQEERRKKARKDAEDSQKRLNKLLDGSFRTSKALLGLGWGALKSVGMASVGAGLGGAAFGALAASAGNDRLRAGQLGVSIPQLKSSQTAYGRILGNPESALQQIKAIQTGEGDPEQRKMVAMMSALGLSREQILSKSPAELLDLAIPATKRRAKEIQKSGGQYGQEYAKQFMPVDFGAQDITNILKLSDEELTRQQKKREIEEKRLIADDEAYQRHQNLTEQFNSSIDQFKNQLIEATEPLTEPLSKLSQSVTNIVKIGISSGAAKKAIDVLSTGLNDFAEWIDSDKSRQWLNDVKEDFDEFSGVLLNVTDKLLGFGKSVGLLDEKSLKSSEYRQIRNIGDVDPKFAELLKESQENPSSMKDLTEAMRYYKGLSQEDQEALFSASKGKFPGFFGQTDKFNSENLATPHEKTVDWVSRNVVEPIANLHEKVVNEYSQELTDMDNNLHAIGKALNIGQVGESNKNRKRFGENPPTKTWIDRGLDALITPAGASEMPPDDYVDPEFKKSGYYNPANYDEEGFMISADEGPKEKPSEPSLKETAPYIVDFFMKKGWSKAQASGIAAQLWEESNFRTNIPGDKGEAYGMAQWHGPRQAKFKKLFGHSLKSSSMDEQLEFVNWELNNTESSAGNAIRSAKSAKSAGRAGVSYERPKDTEGAMNRRGGLASMIFDEYSNKIVQKMQEQQKPPQAPTMASGQAPQKVTDWQNRFSVTIKASPGMNLVHESSALGGAV